MKIQKIPKMAFATFGMDSLLDGYTMTHMLITARMIRCTG